MKNRKVIYFLIALIVIVYGGIVVQMFGFFDKEDSIDFETNITEITIEKEKPKEIYKLQLSYSDPFLGKISQFKPITAERTSSYRPQAKKAIKKENLKIPKVKYKGLVQNNYSFKKTGLIVIDEKSYLISKGDEVGGIKILNFKEGDCEYLYDGKRFLIEK